ncbi:cilia- and flagella-associated protein 54-like [Corticium candelabrum]|uniref:cilia- and flagella-associated protein 54-like n=1 Tax=Corticium candelabrum TaxID=121492 RepID=UPI002E26E4BE|nr:cilia- and flagella-associated protein 54-like [Corticium candelabrum]
MAAVDLNALFAPSNPLNVIKKAFEQEHTRFVKAMKKKNTAKNSEDGNSKWATRLFNLWNGYEKRLPSQYMNEKLVSTGEILVKLQEYGLALHQCFDRYILWIERQTGKSTDVLFKEQYFQAEESNETKQTELTIRAFLGRVICAYRLVVSQDSRLESINTQNYTISLLETLRKTMTVSVTNEKLSWLTYNGTIYVYTIARSLMSVGLSSKVLEYLLWVANAMESAVALLAVKYLTWRVTLYAAVCQCYYDCKAGVCTTGTE